MTRTTRPLPPSIHQHKLARANALHHELIECMPESAAKTHLSEELIEGELMGWLKWDVDTFYQHHRD